MFLNLLFFFYCNSIRDTREEFPWRYLLKPARQQILKNCIAFMCEKPHIHTHAIYECQSTTSFESITSQDYHIPTLYCCSAQRSYTPPAESLKEAWLGFFKSWAAERILFSPRKAAAGAAANRAVLLPPCGRAAGRSPRSQGGTAPHRRTGPAPRAAAPLKSGAWRQKQNKTKQSNVVVFYCVPTFETFVIS